MTDYPHDLDIRPLTTWPGPTTPPHRRKASKFASTMSSTIGVLRTEMSMLGARSPVMEVAIPQDQFRLDGRPRATAKAVHPGVVLSLPFTSVGPLRYATDTFTSWQDNLRGIALGLEALRKVERYGIVRRGEQYTGFRALPSGTAMPATSAPMDIDTAYMVLADAAGVGTQTVRTASREQLRDFYRRATKNVHPDAGGTTEGFQLLQEAMRLIGGER